MVFLHFGLTFLFLHWRVGLTSAKTRKGDDGGGESDMLWQIQLFKNGLHLFHRMILNSIQCFSQCQYQKAIRLLQSHCVQKISKMSFMVFMLG